MKRVTYDPNIKLSGFNNLTKSLSFNLYDFCAARNESERESYIRYIGNRFSAKQVTEIMNGIVQIIEAKVLAISDQDYEPWGASSMILVSDLQGSGVDMHLDKSHLCAHTYPDFHLGGEVASFRIDISISTCGEISPLNALNYMFKVFDADVVVMDYVVRGFTRDTEGKRIYMDHRLSSIQEYVDERVLKDYHAIDLVMQSENIWQTKMLRVNHDVQSYFRDPVDVRSDEVRHYMNLIKREMRGVLHNWPD